MTASVTASLRLLLGRGRRRLQDLGRAFVDQSRVGARLARERDPLGRGVLKLVAPPPRVGLAKRGFAHRDVRLCQELLGTHRCKHRDDGRFGLLARKLLGLAAGHPAAHLEADEGAGDSAYHDTPQGRLDRRLHSLGDLHGL